MSVGAPNKVVIGWMEPGGSKQDTKSYIFDYAERYFDSLNISWFAMAPFQDGYLYEIHEGGAGLSYLPGIVEGLNKKASLSWFRVGSRVWAAFMRDNRPYCSFRSESESKDIINGDIDEIVPRGKMKRIVRTGIGYIYIGGTLFLSGTVILTIASFIYLSAISVFVPDIRKLDIDALPYRQWSRVDRISPNTYVDTLRLVDGVWTTNVQPITKKMKEDDASGIGGKIGGEK